MSKINMTRSLEDVLSIISNNFNLDVNELRINGNFIEYELDDREMDNNLYSLELEHSKGGYEGAGEYTCKVYKFIDKFIKQEYYLQYEGEYSSWTDTEWYKVKLVEPIEVITNIFQEVAEKNPLTEDEVILEFKKILSEFIDSEESGIDDLEDFSWDNGDEIENYSICTDKIELVDETENTGDGCDLWKVFKLRIDSVNYFLKWEGTYSSWDSNYWHEHNPTLVTEKLVVKKEYN